MNYLLKLLILTVFSCIILLNNKKIPVGQFAMTDGV